MSMLTPYTSTLQIPVNESYAANGTPDLDKNQESKRIRLLNLSEKSLSLSAEVKDLIRQVGEKTASEKINTIISQLFYGHYENNPLLLQEDLEQAGLTELANKIGLQTFNGFPMNSPRRGDSKSFFSFSHQG